jgi:hypothetical protein
MQTRKARVKKALQERGFCGVQSHYPGLLILLAVLLEKALGFLDQSWESDF